MALTDVIFAVDSIPAIFAVTADPFIGLTSNVFAILGLRALYFLLAAMAAKFHLLNYGLAVVLVFIGDTLGNKYLGHSPIGRLFLILVGKYSLKPSQRTCDFIAGSHSTCMART